LYYCFSKLTSVSWAPLSFLPSQVPYPPPSHLPRCRVDVLCWPQAFKDLFRIRPPLSCPSSFVCGLQKYNLLLYWQWLFSLFLQNNLYHTGNQQEKFSPPSNFSRNQAPINIKGRRNGGGSGATWTGFLHQNPDKTTSVRALPCRLSLLHAPKTFTSCPFSLMRKCQRIKAASIGPPRGCLNA